MIEDNGYNSYDQFHDQLSGAHERAHEDGFYSRGEHTVPIIAPFRDLHGEAHGYQSAPQIYYSRPRYYGYGYRGY